MIPIVICSVLITAIVIERLWTLDAKKVSPKNLSTTNLGMAKKRSIKFYKVETTSRILPLGVILAAGLSSYKSGKDAMIESTETAASIVIHEMEYNLGTLGIIASICPCSDYSGQLLA